MLVETSWYDNRGNENDANVDLDRFAIPLEVARKLDRIRSIMSEKAGREIRIEELMKAAISQFIDANSALLGADVVADASSSETIAGPKGETELVPVREWDPVARQLFMGMIR